MHIDMINVKSHHNRVKPRRRRRTVSASHIFIRSQWVGHCLFGWLCRFMTERQQKNTHRNKNQKRNHMQCIWLLWMVHIWNECRLWLFLLFFFINIFLFRLVLWIVLPIMICKKKTDIFIDQSMVAGCLWPYNFYAYTNANG